MLSNWDNSVVTQLTIEHSPDHRTELARFLKYQISTNVASWLNINIFKVLVYFLTIFFKIHFLKKKLNKFLYTFFVIYDQVKIKYFSININLNTNS